MKHLIDGLHLVATRRDGRSIVIGVTIILFFVLLAIQNGKGAFAMFDLTSFSLLKRTTLFLRAFFDVTSTLTTSALVLTTLGSLLGGINLALAYLYIKLRGELIIKSGLYSGIGLFFAFLGIGCAACGTAFLSIILGFFGFSAVLDILPYQGEEIGYLGIILLAVTTYTLAKKVAAPAVC